MGRYVMRKCKESGDVAVAVAEKAESAAAVGGRKRNTALGESELSSSSSVQLKTRRLAVLAPENSSSPDNYGNSTCSVHVFTSCCSSTGSSESTQFADLENELTVELLATSAGHLVDFRDRSEVHAESGKMESTVMPRESNSRRCSAAEKMPTQDDLEEFFAAAETNLQKQFVDKYNYDIVKDEPMEGRYEWARIQVKP